MKVVPIEECFSQHRLLVMDLTWENEPNRKKSSEKWRLKNGKTRKAVKKQVKEIIATFKSYDDSSKDILRVVHKTL